MKSNNSENYLSSISLILRSSSIILIGTIVGKFLGIINQSILARFLGPSDYGILALSIVFIQLSSAFIFLGLRSGITRYVSVYRLKNDFEGIRSIIFESLIIIFIMNLIVININLLFFQDFFSKFFSSSETTVLFLALPLYTFFYVFFSVSQAFEDTKFVFFSDLILKKLLRVVIFLVLYFFFGLKFFGALVSLFVAFFNFHYFHHFRSS